MHFHRRATIRLLPLLLLLLLDAFMVSSSSSSSSILGNVGISYARQAQYNPFIAGSLSWWPLTSSSSSSSTNNVSSSSRVAVIAVSLALRMSFSSFRSQITARGLRPGDVIHVEGQVPLTLQL